MQRENNCLDIKAYDNYVVYLACIWFKMPPCCLHIASLFESVFEFLERLRH